MRGLPETGIFVKGVDRPVPLPVLTKGSGLSGNWIGAFPGELLRWELGRHADAVRKSKDRIMDGTGDAFRTGDPTCFPGWNLLPAIWAMPCHPWSSCGSGRAIGAAKAGYMIQFIECPLRGAGFQKTACFTE